MTDVLDGPRGNNLLGFLAAIGLLRVLDRAWPTRAVKLGWTDPATGWKPTLSASDDWTPDGVVDAVAGHLHGSAERAEFNQLGDDLPVAVELFRRVAAEARQSAHADPRTADFLAAFGTDAVPAGEEITDTEYRTMRGAGHQHFLGFMRELAAETTGHHLQIALFEPWVYGDGRPAMRWDSADDRRYALRASSPTAEPIRTVRGANRLAIEALPAFPTHPTTGATPTRGFARSESTLTVTWPVWREPLSWQSVRTLLGHPELVRPEPRQPVLGRLGAVEVFRCRRINVDRYRNFTPATSCWGAVDAGISRIQT